MNPILLVAAAIVTAGGVVAVSSRDGRLALAGLATVLVLSPTIADPTPDRLALAARIVAAVLAVYLAWIVVRDPQAVTRGSLLGWPVEAIVASGAFVVGYGTLGLGAPALGPAEAQAAGFALVALSVGPIVYGRDVFRLASGAALLVSGVVLIDAALAGTPSGLEELVTSGLFIGLGGVIAFLVVEAILAGAAGGEVLDDALAGSQPQAARPPLPVAEPVKPPPTGGSDRRVGRRGSPPAPAHPSGRPAARVTELPAPQPPAPSGVRRLGVRSRRVAPDDEGRG